MHAPCSILTKTVVTRSISSRYVVQQSLLPVVMLDKDKICVFCSKPASCRYCLWLSESFYRTIVLLYLSGNCPWAIFFSDPTPSKISLFWLYTCVYTKLEKSASWIILSPSALKIKCHSLICWWRFKILWKC